MYNNVVYSGCSLTFLEQELTKVKGLLTKVNLMTKPDNFTYVDCANLCQLLEGLKATLERQVKEAKLVEERSA